MERELATGLPSVRYVQRLTREKQTVEAKLLTNEVIMGKILWQDPDSLCLEDQAGQTIVVWRQALAYLRPISG